MRRSTGVVYLLLSLVMAQQITAGFSTCKFNFGMAWDGNRSYPSEVDYLTIWAGSDENWNDYWIGDMLRACRSNGKTPVLYSYIIAFTARRDWGLADCDVSGSGNLCTDGARFIREEWSRIISQYEKYASNTARVFGTSQQIIWLMEPDYYQYNSSRQSGGGLSAQELAQKMSELVGIVKKHLPNAKISMDISPWTPDQRSWFSNFNMAQFSFMNTSGGRTDADSDRIRNENHTTWKSIWDISGKGIIADDGYGVGGGSIGHDATWDDPNNINARIEDGVIAITQASPRSDWGSIIASIRPQLNTPLACSGGQPPSDPESYSISVSTSGQGSVSKSPNQSSYSSGSTVSLTATPANGYVFSGWSGDVTGTANPISVTMNSNKVITANFSAESTTPTHPGSEMLINGNFSSGVTPWHQGVYGGSASGQVTNGEYVTSISSAGTAAWNIQFTQSGIALETGKTYTLSFRARAASSRTVQVNVGMSSSPYTSYMGSFDAELTTSMKTFTKTFTMTSSSDANARVEFNSGLSSINWYLDDVSLVEGTGSISPPETYSLETTVSGQGSVSRSPGGSGYESGTTVSLTATPAAGYVFSGWSGDASGTANPLSVTMNGNKSITATFTAQTVSYVLETGVVGQGSVSRSPSGSSYESGTTVSLTAIPAAGYVFSGWSGDASGTANPLSVTMNGNKSITATFTAQTVSYVLETGVVGQGSVSRSPSGSSYESGTTVSLTAIPAAGYVFSGWSGDASGTVNPLSVTMDGSKSITATFTELVSGGTELLKNGGFSSGTAPWQLGVYGGSASGRVVNGEYATSISRAGTQAWHVQLIQTGVNLERGKTYTISFKARASAPGTVVANVGMSTSPWSSYMGSFDVDLTTSMKTFTKTFTMEAGSDANARVEFNSGLSAVNWYLDDVSLMEGTGSVTPPSEPSQFSLEVTVNGSGTVGRSPQASSYDSNMVVSLTATPAQGYVFSGWGGDASGSVNPLSVTMNSDKAITASFVAQTVNYSLTLNVEGQGTVAKSPEAAEYASGTVVELIATPSQGYVFSGWSGDASGVENPLLITVGGNSTVTATFTQQPTTDPSTELLVNGDFSSGTTPWHLGAYGGADARGSVKNGEYVISSSSGGSATWNIQFTQTGVKLQKGKAYTLTFEARAASPRSMEVNVGMGSSPWVSCCGAFKADLTTNMQRFSKTFVMEQNTDLNARMEFNAGLATSTIYIDNVSIVEEAMIMGKRTTDVVNVVNRESTWSLRLAGEGMMISTPAGGYARITLYDIRGRSMGTLFSGTLRAGHQLISLGKVSAGHYIMVLKDSVGKSVLRKRLVISE